MSGLCLQTVSSDCVSVKRGGGGAVGGARSCDMNQEP